MYSKFQPGEIVWHKRTLKRARVIKADAELYILEEIDTKRIYRAREKWIERVDEEERSD